ncbi:unnamed protein product [Periconia digitata]|uniref:Uncharacterized protein n=1 Tax=Periconia digitata TaxID=1303443 RepID=A0A9W4XPL2_9PLEO|nr:unnamed protein product [Periconia digitata]
MSTGREREGCVAAWRYRCRDPSRLCPYLAIYSAVRNKSFIKSAEFGNTNQYHELLPEGGPI